MSSRVPSNNPDLGIQILESLRSAEHPQLFDMEVIVRRQDHPRCASITYMIRHYVAEGRR